MALTDNLISFWELEEASGTRNDARGANHLTDNNTVTQAVGKVGNAAQFTAANNEYLSVASNSDFVLGTGDFTFCGWFYFDSLVADTGMAGKDRGPVGEWTMAYILSTQRITPAINDQSNQYPANSLGAPVINTWYFVVFWRDTVAGTYNVQVNNGTVDSTVDGTNPNTSVFDVEIGRARLASTDSPMDGRIDQVGFWKRVLTTQERTDLYNGGAGLSYAAMTPDNPVTALRRVYYV